MLKSLPSLIWLTPFNKNVLDLRTLKFFFFNFKKWLWFNNLIKEILRMLKKKEQKIASQDRSRIQKIRAKLAARLSRHDYRYDMIT